MIYTRRDIGKMALAALPAARLMAAKPNSLWGGVQVGINVPYSYGNNNMSADDTLNNTLQLGLSAVELRTQPVESFLGAPGGGGGRRGGQMTPEQQAAADALKKWRLSQTTDDFKRFRKKYEDAGVLIQIVKVDWMSQNIGDDVADYCFEMTKALGATVLSCEIPRSQTKWLGAIAAKHKIMVGYHGHESTGNPESFAGPDSWDMALESSPYNGINLDIGHFMSANKISPIPFMHKYHDKITHIHVKDMTVSPDKAGVPVAFGTGNVPIIEVLQLMKSEKWKFQAAIEYEVREVPAGSTRPAEWAKCVEYCKKALV